MKRRDIVPISGKNIDYLILGGKNIVEDKTIKILRILVIIMLNVFLIGLVANLSGTGSIMTLSKYGSRGNEVRQIQTRLKELGYNPGTIDGIYGTNTQNAVKAFQRDKGLSVDGIAGPKTLKALGISSGSSSNAGYTQNDINLLARIISAESRGESYTGQVAIGAVVLNRVEHPSFPDTIAGVIYQPGAFTAITDGQFNEPVAESSVRAAKEALNGSDPTGGAIYYYNPDKTSNEWIRSRPVIVRIGNHLFCG